MVSPPPELGTFRTGGLAALLAVAALGGTDAAGVMGSPPAVTVGPPSAPAAADTSPADTAARGFRGGEALLREYFGRQSGPIACPGTVPADRVGGCLDVLIATLPDPYDSRMDWSYDAQLNALLRAHETSGFVMDRFRLAEGNVQHAGETVPARHVQPGVVLFRSAHPNEERLRLLYLVGEIPTSGVHRAALEAALDERVRLLGIEQSAEDLVRVVGPTFSGSAPSLQRTLSGWLRDRGNSRARIVSGAATGESNAVVFARDSSRLTYSALVNSDGRLGAALDSAVLQRLGVHATQVAILRESTTAYGLGLDDSPEGYLSVPFPMNVSLLRREYEENPRKGVTLDARIPLGGADHRLATDLRDTARAREGLPVVSPLTAPAVEAVFGEIVRTLRAHDIRAVGVQATDVRDKLFVAEEIRRRMHDVQLFTFESNVLYVRDDRSTSLRGMLVLSTYPLLLENRLWRGNGHRREMLPFVSDGAQGTYNAALVHLTLESAPLLEFPRADDPIRPPVWVSVVGTRSVLPLTVWQRPASWDSATAGRVSRSVPQRMTPGASEAAATFVLLLLCAGIAGVSVSAMRTAMRSPVPRTAKVGESVPQRVSAPLAEPARQLAAVGAVGAVGAGPAGGADTGQRQGKLYLAFIRIYRGWCEAQTSRLQRWEPLLRDEREARWEVLTGSLLLHRELYSLLRVLALGGVTAPLAVVLMRSLTPTSGLAQLLLWVVLIGGGAALLLHLGRSALILRRYGKVGSFYLVWSGAVRGPTGWLWVGEVVLRTGVVLLGLVFAGVCAAYALNLAALPPGAMDLLQHRAVRFESGVSPVLTVVLAGAGFALWCTWHLQRVEGLSGATAFERACLDRAHDGARRDSEEPEERAARAVADVRERLFLMIPHPHAVGLLIVMVGGVAYLVSQFRPSLEATVHPAGAVGPAWFDVVLLFGITGTLVATAWAVYRLLALWSALRRLLGALEETPLAETLGKLPPHVGRLARVGLLGGVAPEAVDKLVKEKRQRLRALDSVDGAEAWRPHARVWEDGNPGTAFREEYCRLKNLWNSGDNASAALRQALEELVAVQVVDYLEATLRQFRQLALFLFASLILTTLFVSSYPFHPQALVKLVFMGVLAATVGSLLLVMAQSNAEPVLSRIAGTTGGKVTLDFTFVLNAMLVAVVPLLTLIGSEYPAVRVLLLAWLEPLAKALGAG